MAENWIYNPHKQDTRFTDAVDDLVEKSPLHKREFEENDGIVRLSVKYKPTDLTKSPKAELREIDGGFDINRTCPTCHMALAKNGACTGLCDF